MSKKKPAQNRQLSLSQLIDKEMKKEFKRNGYPTIRWRCLQTFYFIVIEADDPDNHSIYYDDCDGKRQIVICDIPSLMKWGTDFDRERMRSALLGLAEAYKDDRGMYLVHTLVTHDLNSATISDVDGLMNQLTRTERNLPTDIYPERPNL